MREADEFASATSALALSAGREPVPARFADRVLDVVRSEGQTAPTTAPRRGWRWVSILAAAALGLAAILGFQVYETQQELERQEAALSALLHQDGIALRGPSGAAARVVPKGNGALFAAVGLQKAPAGHTYQLWLLREGADPVSGGVFDMSDGIAVIEVGESLGQYEGAAVTIELDGGSAEGPTTDPILQG
jgi:anti-sigma-K factor RskA